MLQKKEPIDSTTINANEIINEIDKIKEYFTDQTINKSRKILDELLEKINKINFREYAEISDEKEKLQKKHYLVIVIEVLLKTANENSFDLCRKNEIIYLFNSQYWENIESEDFKDFLSCVYFVFLGNIIFNLKILVSY